MTLRNCKICDCNGYMDSVIIGDFYYDNVCAKCEDAAVLDWLKSNGATNVRKNYTGHYVKKIKKSNRTAYELSILCAVVRQLSKRKF